MCTEPGQTGQQNGDSGAIPTAEEVQARDY